MNDDVYQSIQRSWTIESASTDASSAYRSSEIVVHNGQHNNAAAATLDERIVVDPAATLQHDGGLNVNGHLGLHRQTSALTQVVSNRTVDDDVQMLRNNSLQNDFSSSQGTSLISEPDQHQQHHESVSSFMSSLYDDEKTTSSNTTVTTATASFVANTPNTSLLGYTSFSDVYYSDGESRIMDESSSTPSVLPLHLLNDDEYVYYRIVYRGVVPLLSAPDERSPRSGKYLCYGEVFACRRDVASSNSSVPRRLTGNGHNPTLGKSETDTLLLTNVAPRNLLENPLPLSPRSRVRSAPTTTDQHAILRVDKFLTGGYAVDAPGGSYGVDLEAETPKRSNNTTVDFTAPDSIWEQHDTAASSLGYLLVTTNGVVVAEPLTTKPIVEVLSSTTYKVMSSAPIPILTGPSFDAPKTKAVLLPGSVHEISLRICFDPEGSSVFFLRLSHRRGWVADRQGRYGRGNNKLQFVPVMMEVSQNSCNVDDVSISGFSSVSTTLDCSTTTSRHRHRPPRRMRIDNNIDVAVMQSGPNQIVGKPSQVNGNYNVGSIRTTERLANPSSNVSILSEDSSFDHDYSIRSGAPTSPDRSSTMNKSGFSKQISASTAESYFFLMRVTAPGGLKILDAPHFQVNSLIHRGHPNTNVSSSHSVSLPESKLRPPKTHHSIFQTMSGRLTTTGPSKAGNPAVFDATSKTRVLPRGAIFEASRRMEGTGAFSQGAGLVKLSDNSGWAIIPRQDELDGQYRNFSGGVAGVKEGEATRAYEEVGNAIISPRSAESGLSSRPNARWIRVTTRSGIRITCAPPVGLSKDGEASPSSSRGSSACGSNMGSTCGPVASSDSDVASSVGSSFLDAMFRTPKKKEITRTMDPSSLPRMNIERHHANVIPTIPCGSFVEVEQWSNSSDRSVTQEYARLRGGQGWVPMCVAGKTTAVPTTVPEFRHGSIWFRVQSLRGIKVREGPSQRAPSMKSEEGVHLRFECGEFLRASEVVTVFADDGRATETFAKLYRNRHVQLHAENTEYVQLASLTSIAEWVQVYNENELFLEECAAEPRLERHKKGWRYNVVPDTGIEVRKGPSFASEKTGIILFGGESILITERVSPPGDNITWLRMNDRQGWVYDVDENGESMMIAHSLRYRTYLHGKQRKPEAPRADNEIAYNTIIARLFHNDGTDEPYKKNMNLS